MQKVNPIQFVVGAVFTFLVLYLMYRVVAFLWWIGMFIAPVLLLASLVINRRPLLNYIQMLGNTFWKSPVRGVIYAALSLFGLPIVAAYIFFQAFMGNKMEKAMSANGGQDFFQQFMQQQFSPNGQDAFKNPKQDSEYTAYEEVDSRPKTNASTGNSNDDLFRKYTENK